MQIVSCVRMLLHALRYLEHHLAYRTMCYHVQVALAVDDTKAIQNKAHMSKIEIQVCMVGYLCGVGPEGEPGVGYLCGVGLGVELGGILVWCEVRRGAKGGTRVGRGQGWRQGWDTCVGWDQRGSQGWDMCVVWGRGWS